jgi:hypothetical protein
LAGLLEGMDSKTSLALEGTKFGLEFLEVLRSTVARPTSDRIGVVIENVLWQMDFSVIIISVIDPGVALYVICYVLELIC